MSDPTHPDLRRPAYGVHSEVGRLRKVLVCAPGLAHRRLTPTNCDELLFDDVMWVQNGPARPLRLRDQAARARRRGRRAARPARRDRGPARGQGLAARPQDRRQRGRARPRRRDPRRSSTGSTTRTLAEFLIGGLATTDLPDDFRPGYVALAREPAGVRDYLMPPLPNTLYTRDTTCWIYGGVTLNPLYWPARHDETLLMKAIYEFHPDFVGATVWWGDPELDWGLATLRGRRRHAVRQRRRADRHERAHARARRSRQVAAALFDQRRRRAGGRGRHAEAAGRHAPRHRVHLRRPRLSSPPSPTSSTASRRSRCARPTAAAASRSPVESSSFVDVVADALGLPELRVIETGGDVYASRAPAVGQRQQPRRARAGRRVRLRPQHHHQRPAAPTPASRSSRSSAPSSAAAAVAGTA